MVVKSQLHSLKNHIALTSCHEIAQIMLPMLNVHGVTVFNYYRRYFDDSLIRFSTDSVWTEHYLKKDYLNKMTVPQSYLLKPVNYFIWLTEDCPEMLLDAAVNFDTSNGISLAFRHEHYIECFCFASTRNNTAIINNFYLNNLDILKNYCHYFKERADPLLQSAEKNKFIITNQTLESDGKQPLIKLSKRQRDCATLLLKGMMYKEIGAALNLSSRTVETHLNQLKIKLNCHNK